MQLAANSYIFPPRPTKAIPRDQSQIYADYGWLAQLKYNDTRILIKQSNGKTEIWNRHAERIRSYHPPEELQESIQNLLKSLKANPNKVTLLDGGLLDQKHQAIKDTIVIWDILVHNDDYKIDTTYESRKQILNDLPSTEWVHQNHILGKQIQPGISIPIDYPSKYWDGLWEEIDTINKPHLTQGRGPLIEGLVFKDPNGTLDYGFQEKNNDHWNARSRVKTGRHNF